jgi:hypothetical protein
MTENDRRFLVMVSESNPGGTTAQVAGRILAEIDRLRAELAAAKAEPPRPVAIMANPDGDVHAFEYMPDYHVTPQPCGSWGYTLRSWTWHPKSP